MKTKCPGCARIYELDNNCIGQKAQCECGQKFEVRQEKSPNIVLKIGIVIVSIIFITIVFLLLPSSKKTAPESTQYTSVPTSPANVKQEVTGMSMNENEKIVNDAKRLIYIFENFESESIKIAKDKNVIAASALFEALQVYNFDANNTSKKLLALCEIEPDLEKRRTYLNLNKQLNTTKNNILELLYLMIDTDRLKKQTNN